VIIPDFLQDVPSPSTIVAHYNEPGTKKLIKTLLPEFDDSKDN
jgi:hypothetical protein